MASQAKKAKGTSIQVESPEGSGLFVKIPGALDITLWSIEPEEIDATDQESPDDFEEVVPSIKKMSAATFGMNEFPGNAIQKQLRLDTKVNKVRKYRGVENDGDWEEHYCFVKITRERRIRGLRMANVTLRATTKPIFSDE